MSEAECKQWILDTIDSLRSRKARPDLERICKMVQRRHGLAPSRTRRQLERLLRSRTVLRVSYKGSHSYRNAAKWHSGRDKGSGQGAGAPGAPARDKPRLQTEQQQQRRQQRDSGGGGGGSVLTRARLKGVLEQQVARGRSRNPRGGESEPPDRRRMRRRRLPVTAAPTDRKKTRRSKEADPSDREGSDEETATPLKNHDSARPTSSEAQNGVEPLTDCVSEEPDAEECPIKPPTTEDVEELPADQRVETSSAVEQSPSRCPSTECKGDIDDKMELDVEDLQTVPERVCPGDAGAVGSSEVPTPIEEGSNEEWSQEPCTNQDEAAPELEVNDRQGPVLCEAGETSQSTGDRPLAECDHMTCHQQEAKTTDDTWLSKDCNPRNADDPLDTMLLGQLPSANPSPKREEAETAAGLSTDPRDTVPEAGGTSCLLTPSASPVDMVPEENGPTDRHLLEENEKSVDPTEWSIADVVNYFKEAGFPEQAGAFEDQEIDGKSLLLMKRNDVLTGLAIKLGPALKIYEYHIKVLQLHHFNNEAPSC